LLVTILAETGCDVKGEVGVKMGTKGNVDSKTARVSGKEEANRLSLELPLQSG
jgi:hypothetical protein